MIFSLLERWYSVTLQSPPLSRKTTNDKLVNCDPAFSGGAEVVGRGNDKSPKGHPHDIGHYIGFLVRVSVSYLMCVVFRELLDFSVLLRFPTRFSLPPKFSVAAARVFCFRYFRRRSTLLAPRLHCRWFFAPIFGCFADALIRSSYFYYFAAFLFRDLYDNISYSFYPRI